MITSRVVTIGVGFLLACFFSGCEYDLGSVGGDSNDETSDAAPAESSPSASTEEKAALPEPAVDGNDQLDVSSAHTLGPHSDIKPQHANTTRTLFAANIEGGKVHLSFEKLHWPEQHGSKSIDGSVHIYWHDGGRVIGGYFDAHGVGQTVKGLENITGGYLSGRQPKKGDTVWFCLVSLDGKQRTNTAQSQSHW